MFLGQKLRVLSLLSTHLSETFGGFGGGAGFTLAGGGFTFACSRPSVLGGGGLEPFTKSGLLITAPLFFQ
jgi:hypothetical protein